MGVNSRRMKKHPPPLNVTRARAMRREPTAAEVAMWRLLRANFGDWRFRRQVPLDHYIADFASHRARLVIECDGGQHSPEADAARTRAIEGEGYRVLRFWNNEVLGNAEGVARIIAGVLGGLSPPSGVSPPSCASPPSRLR
jgi:very-short-patch-repair endonuclease